MKRDEKIEKRLLIKFSVYKNIIVNFHINNMNLTTVSNYSKSNPTTSIKSKLESKSNILQFLPQCLDSLSVDKNFIYKDQKLKTAYIIDITHNLILKYYFKKENKFHLLATILKEKYGYLYNYYIDYLVERNILLLLSNHLKGKSSRVYAISESVLRGKITRYNNFDKVLLKKYKSKLSQIEENDIESSLINKDVKIKLVNDLFGVEIEFYRSVFYLDGLKNEDTDIYNRNKYSVECINDKHIFYHFDNYGRMHTNFTILKSFIRKNCLLIDGEETCEMDIKNSQPLFLSKLIQDSNTKWVNKNEFELFKDLTLNGNFYQYIMDNIKTKNRNMVKELTYKVLFGRNGTTSKADKIFCKLFPTIHNFIKLYKKDFGDYKILAYDLQKAESNLIFNKIIKQIMDLYPDVKVVTVHDSIIVPRKNKEEIWAIFQTKIYEEFGLI